MNTIKKIIFTILLCVSCNAVIAQNLRSMSAAERNALLISIAKEVVLIYGPDYYREYREPIIERHTIPQRGVENPEGIDAGRVIYHVTFLYDKTQERLATGFAAKVRIWGDTGIPLEVTFGNEDGRLFVESRWHWNREVETIPFQQSIFPIYDINNPDPNQMPRNIEELTRHGFVRDEYGQWVRTRPDEPPAEAQRVIRRAQEELRQRQAQREKEGSGGRR